MPASSDNGVRQGQQVADGRLLPLFSILVSAVVSTRGNEGREGLEILKMLAFWKASMLFHEKNCRVCAAKYGCRHLPD